MAQRSAAVAVRKVNMLTTYPGAQPLASEQTRALKTPCPPKNSTQSHKSSTLSGYLYYRYGTHPR